MAASVPIAAPTKRSQGVMRRSFTHRPPRSYRISGPSRFSIWGTFAKKAVTSGADSFLGHILHHDALTAQLHLVAVTERDRCVARPLTVYPDPVAAAKVLDGVAILARRDQGVVSRYRGLVDHNLVFGRTPNPDLLVG